MAKRWNVYVTRMLPQAVIDVLKDHCDVEMNSEPRALTRDELLQKIRGRDAVLSQATDIIDEVVLDAAAPSCKIIANYAVGYNNFSLEAASRMSIMLTNTPDVVTDATVEMAWALLFATARRVVEADKFLRAGKFKGLDPMLMIGITVSGKTLGVVGAGRIGRSFAQKAQAFSMKVIYHDVKPNPAFEAETGAVYVDMETLLGRSDFISLHVPLLPETRHLIGARELKMMKKTAILINTSRGPVVNEKELVAGLKAGEIWGAGLDVYENEPEIEPGLKELDNVVLLPHIGTATIETRINMGLVAAKNILAAMRGEVPPNLLNAAKPG